MDSPKLTAKELNRRYQQGERYFVGIDLSGESLRGMNLRRVNLTGADLSYTDLQGTDFTNATLVSTRLCGAKTGTQRHWNIPKVLGTLLLVILSSFFQSAIWGLFANLIFSPTDLFSNVTSIFAGILGLIALGVFLVLNYVKGILTTIGFALITGALLGGFSIALVIVSASSILQEAIAAITVIVIFVTALGVAGAFAFMFSIATTAAIGVSNIVTIAVGLIGTFTGSLTFAFNSYFDDSDFKTAGLGVAIAFIGSTITLVTSCLISHRGLQGDLRDRLIRDIAVWFAGWGGTQFKRADLTDADCSHATLRNAHFYGATLTRTRFHLAQKLNLARFDKTILSDFAVQDLLITLRGRGKSYAGKNLKGSHLAGSDLVGADFTEADLSQTTLEGAELQEANLTKTQVLGTQFRQANLTGACLEAWNIDSTTQLGGVLCDYVYLLKPPQERRPNSGIFQPGEFTKLFEEVLDTVDLIFQNGIDWKAFVKAFDKVRVDNDGTELTIQSIENKGDGVIVVRVDVPPNTDKEKIHSEFKQTYEEIRQQLEAQYKQQLNAKDREIEIYEQQSVQMWSVINRLAESPPVSTIENILGNKVVNDQSQTFQGNVSINAQNSVVNLRDISGQVSNQINQLPTESAHEQLNLKDLLTQLQSVIEADSELGEDEKAEALAEVGELANAAKSPKDGVMQKLAKRAINALKGIAASLSDASKLTSACKELLPLIMTAFGLP